MSQEDRPSEEAPGTESRAPEEAGVPAGASGALSHGLSTTWFLPVSGDGVDADGFARRQPDDDDDPLSQISLADLENADRMRSSINTPEPMMPSDVAASNFWDGVNVNRDMSPSSSPSMMLAVNPLKAEGLYCPETSWPEEEKEEKMEVEDQQGKQTVPFDIVQFVINDDRSKDEPEFVELLGGTENAVVSFRPVALASSSEMVAAPAALRFFPVRPRPNCAATVTSADSASASSDQNDNFVVVAALEDVEGRGGGGGQAASLSNTYFMTLDVSAIWPNQQPPPQQQLPLLQSLPSFGKKRVESFGHRRREADLDHSYQTATAVSSSSSSAAAAGLGEAGQGDADVTPAALNSRQARTRELNNIASRKCRENRKLKLASEQNEEALLRVRNEGLKRRLSRQVDRLRRFKRILVTKEVFTISGWKKGDYVKRLEELLLLE